jgi:uncharacterized membrane protein (DUF2068 family)
MTRRPSLLPWIVAFKGFKSTTLIVVGIVLLVTRKDDPVDVLTRTALAIHLPLTSRLFDKAVATAWNLTDARQTALAFTAFGYAVLLGSEGLALHWRKPWARWFTIVATASLLPIEVYEVIREVHLVRVFVLIANVAILVYLWRRKDLLEGE